MYGKESKLCRTPALGKSDVGSIYQQYVSGAVRRFQDAYTYNCRDEVFSNAQTGNVVLMSQNFLEGNFTAGLRYLFPILFLRWVYFWQKFPGALPVCKEAALAAGTSRGGNCDPCDRRIYSVLL